MPTTETCEHFYRWGSPTTPAKRPARRCRGDRVNHQVQWEVPETYYFDFLDWLLRAERSDASALRLQAEQLRVEFTALAKRWIRDTQHLSLVSKKVAHPAYFRIMGMGQAVVPLLLEALRDNPRHWFVALRATANTDPSPAGAGPSTAREAWLKWGRDNGLID